MCDTPESEFSNQARAYARKVPWRTVLTASVGASAVGLLAAGGLAPLILPLLGMVAGDDAVREWVVDTGGNVLAGWLGDAAGGAVAEALRKEPDPAEQVRLLGEELAKKAQVDQAFAADLARLVSGLDLTSAALDGMAEEIGAQSDLLLAQFQLLQRLQQDVATLPVAQVQTQAVLVAQLKSQSEHILQQIDRRFDAQDEQLNMLRSSIQELAKWAGTTLSEPRMRVDISTHSGNIHTGHITGRDLHHYTIHAEQVIFHAPANAPGSIPQSISPTPAPPHAGSGNIPPLARPHTPLSDEQLLTLAEQAYAQGNWSEADRLYTEYGKRRPADTNVQTRLTETRQLQKLGQRYTALATLRKEEQFEQVLAELQALRREGYTFDIEGHQQWAEQRQFFWQRFDAANAAYSSGHWAEAITTLKSLLFDFPGASQVKDLLGKAETELARVAANEITAAIQAGQVDTALNAAAARLQQHPADYEALFETAWLIERSDLEYAFRRRAAELVAHHDLRPGVVTIRPSWAEFVPAGSYSIAEGLAVELATFRVSRYPVTLAQYAEFVKSGAYDDHPATNAWWTEAGLHWRSVEAASEPYRGSLPDVAHWPVSGVSWYEAAAFCRWLTWRGHMDGWLDPRALIRLPTEAEWLVAAGWDPVQQKMQSLPPETNDHLNCDDHDPPFDQPTPVGLFPSGASPLDAFDMAGNVWEWCASSAVEFPHDAHTAVVDFTADQSTTAVRGGSFREPARRCGWQARRILTPNTRADDVGFRVCLSTSEAPHSNDNRANEESAKDQLYAQFIEQYGKLAIFRQQDNWRGVIESYENITQNFLMDTLFTIDLDPEGYYKWAKRQQDYDERCAGIESLIDRGRYLTALQECRELEALIQTRLGVEIIPNTTQKIYRLVKKALRHEADKAEIDGDSFRSIRILRDLHASYRTSREDPELRKHLKEIEKKLTDIVRKSAVHAFSVLRNIQDYRPGVMSLDIAWGGLLPLPKAEKDPKEFVQINESGKIEFQIARFPVNVWQYSQFIKDNGYQKDLDGYWPHSGVQWRNDEEIRHPHRWEYQDQNCNNQPITGISWYEAVAFCRWLTERYRWWGWLANTEELRLPTKLEWRLAANYCAETGREEEPNWGKVFLRPRNCISFDINTPTPMGVFPENISPCGAFDMAGNVWEWCSSGRINGATVEYPVDDFAEFYDTPDLCGGSYLTEETRANWSSDNQSAPSDRNPDFGFRLCRSPVRKSKIE